MEQKKSTPVSPASEAEKQIDKPAGTTESFLDEYDPEAIPFMADSPIDEAPLWVTGGELALKLLLVIGLIYLVLIGLRWLQGGRSLKTAGGATIRVLETTHLTPGRALHLVVVGEKTLLIGATDHQLSVLTELVEITPVLPEDSHAFDEALTQAQTASELSPTSEWHLAFDRLRTTVRHLRNGASEPLNKPPAEDL